MAEPVPPLRHSGQAPSDPSAAATVAREVNAVIREMAERLDTIAHDERPVGFLCECGCLAIVPATVAQYDAADGAWLEEHEPT